MGFEVLWKGTNFLRLLGGLWTALRISMISVILSIFLGSFLGMLMTRNGSVIKVISKVYLEIVRIMPQMVLLFLVYFGATKAFGLNLSAETSACIVFTFWGTAEMGDLVRGAMQSIPRSQYESSKALGFSDFHMYLFIIIPQIVRRLLPQSINLITRVIKTTSLVMMIGIVEVLKVAQQIVEANRSSSPNAAFGVFATVFLLYYLMCRPFSLLAGYLERKWET